jgi:hypothetical protein
VVSETAGARCSPPSSAEFKNECSYTSTPSTCVYGVDRDLLAHVGLHPLFWFILKHSVFKSRCASVIK